MDSVRRLLAIPLIAVIAMAGLSVSAAPAQAAAPDPPCEWDSYRTRSSCDGLMIENVWDACGQVSTGTVHSARITTPDGILLAHVWLNYQRGVRTSAHPGGICRLIDVSLGVVNPDAGCYAKVERTSDGQAYYTYQTNGHRTQAVYDASVTSYGWGICTYLGRTYSAQTPAY